MRVHPVEALRNFGRSAAARVQGLSAAVVGEHHRECQPARWEGDSTEFSLGQSGRLGVGECRPLRGVAGEELKVSFSNHRVLDAGKLHLGGALEMTGKTELQALSGKSCPVGPIAVEWNSERKAFADVHCQVAGELSVGGGDLRLRLGYDVAAESGFADKETLRAQSGGGSFLEISGEASVAQGVGSKAGLSFARQKADPEVAGSGASTEVGLVLGGSVLAGAAAEVRVKLADADLEAALNAALPMTPVFNAAVAAQKASGHIMADLLRAQLF